MSLADLYERLATIDTETVKEASEQEKVAADEDAAGRIVARGFMDELSKLAGEMDFKPTPVQRAGSKATGSGPGNVTPPTGPSSIVNPGGGAGMVATQKKFKKSVYE